MCKNHFKLTLKYNNKLNYIQNLYNFFFYTESGVKDNRTPPLLSDTEDDDADEDEFHSEGNTIWGT